MSLLLVLGNFAHKSEPLVATELNDLMIWRYLKQDNYMEGDFTLLKRNWTSFTLTSTASLNQRKRWSFQTSSMSLWWIFANIYATELNDFDDLRYFLKQENNLEEL